MRTNTLAFGITAAERPDAARLGQALTQLGYEELWSNDTRRGDGIAALAATSSDAPSLALGVGVVALSDQDPAQIAQRVRASGIEAARLVVGVGSGSSASLGLVRSGVAELRRLLPGRPIGVAAVGPRMARLAGEVADAVVANWALPDRLALVRRQVHEGASAADRPPPRLVAYVRTAVGPGAEERLDREMARYAGYGPHYARAFAAQPDVRIGVAVERPESHAVDRALAPYREIADTVVVRGLPASDTVDEWLEIAGAASPE